MGWREGPGPFLMWIPYPISSITLLLHFTPTLIPVTTSHHYPDILLPLPYFHLHTHPYSIHPHPHHFPASPSHPPHHPYIATSSTPSSLTPNHWTPTTTLPVYPYPVAFIPNSHFQPMPFPLPYSSTPPHPLCWSPPHPILSITSAHPILSPYLKMKMFEEGLCPFLRSLPFVNVWRRSLTCEGLERAEKVQDLCEGLGKVPSLC